MNLTRLSLYYLAGYLLFALGVFVAQVIRHRVTVLYPMTLAVRAVILVVIAALYVKSSDPFFVVLLGIVGLGVVLTGTAYLRERREAA
jgi:uncharacterized membrane protein YoaK (UPF0700 family)